MSIIPSLRATNKCYMFICVFCVSDCVSCWDYWSLIQFNKPWGWCVSQNNEQRIHRSLHELLWCGSLHWNVKITSRSTVVQKWRDHQTVWDHKLEWIPVNKRASVLDQTERRKLNQVLLWSLPGEWLHLDRPSYVWVRSSIWRVCFLPHHRLCSDLWGRTSQRTAHVSWQRPVPC